MPNDIELTLSHKDSVKDIEYISLQAGTHCINWKCDISDYNIKYDPKKAHIIIVKVYHIRLQRGISTFENKLSIYHR